MKRFFLLFTIALLWYYPMEAQHQKPVKPHSPRYEQRRGKPGHHGGPVMNERMFKEKYQRLIQKKWQFVQERLRLSPREARELKPVMEAYDKAMMKLVIRKRKILRRLKKNNPQPLSAAQAAGEMDKLLAIEKEMHRVKMKYYSQIQRILPPRKALELIGLEDAWRHRLMQYRRKHRQKPGQPDRPHILKERQ
ncbi:MAG: hypothetical protein GXO24_02895 [Chlorobi bacterium]|nr:hypothetical protein [Chlorobiota bacterium]